MKITYDEQADAVYIYLSAKSDHLETLTVDPDINLDFDTEGRLRGVEVLDAAKRLDLEYLLPHAEMLGERGVKWEKLRKELLRRKHAGEPVVTTVQHVKNWVKDVGEDYVELVSERSPTKRPRRVFRHEIEDADTEKYIGRRRIIAALREAGYYI